MIQEAEAHKAEDEKRKALVEAKNQADALVHQTEKTLNELGDKVSADDKANITKAIDDLKAVLKDENATKEQIDEKVKALTAVSHKLAEQAYAKDQAGANAGAGEGASKKDDDDVIDAEVE